ncbi:ABC transporter permease [Actinopolymorpha pittospori]|uniref:Peptide/nickel transport system permease protein n=1 Tax=Actinopolymorpha pittospori TaxID=648752 RepID=A0A927R5U2_9ACTN|nr:ABC transporter permease [Actinopolymorpha pittospori]MBE1603692.1 peptide/nickel transport system permease protein [Actinopolymorpha pittospori]
MSVAYILRRIGQFLIVVWVASTVNFFLPRLGPGDPVRNRLLNAQVTGGVQSEGVSEIVQAYNRQFGLDKPLVEQYLIYLWNLVHFDFGFSIASYPTRASTLIFAAIPWTLGLLLVATLVAFFIGTLLGSLAAWPRSPQWVRHLSVPVMGLSAVPYYLIGLALIYLLAVLVPVFPSSGGYSLGATPSFTLGFAVDVLSHSFMPAAAIVASSVGFWALSMRGMMITTVGEEFVNLADAKGLKANRVFVRYALRNALLPQVTHLALSIGHIVSGSIIVEVVFGYPGVGVLLFNAITGEDYFVIYGVVFIVVLAIALSTLIVDLLYPLLDPRIAYGRT